MKASQIALLLLSAVGLSARPAPVNMPVGELFQMAPVVVVIRPTSACLTKDVPDRADPYLDNRDLTLYQGIETECEVLSVLKGSATTKLRILHFAWKDHRPEFNGGIFIYFHLGEVFYESYPAKAYGKPDGRRYAVSHREYLAFLRELPDGRFAPILGQYDSACSFRLLSILLEGPMYYARDDSPWRKWPNKAPEPTPTAVTSPAAQEPRQP